MGKSEIQIDKNNKNKKEKRKKGKKKEPTSLIASNGVTGRKRHSNVSPIRSTACEFMSSSPEGSRGGRTLHTTDW